MRTIRVANRTPNATEIAIGIRNCACKLRSKRSGVKPAKVVSEVRRIGLKRLSPARQRAD